MKQSGALAGITVLELSRYVAAPYAGALLADLGATVIKVEGPPSGDPYRGWGKDGYSSVFCSINRGKKSVVLNLGDQGDRERLMPLLDASDVLIENFRPGTMKRFGLDYPAMAERNPGLIYCSITGYGSTGPYSDRPGYDTVGQAASGLLSLLTDRERPQGMGISISDHLAGVFAAYGILAALAARSTTGLGQWVETSLLQASTSFLAENMARFLNDGGPAPSRDTRARSAQVYALVDAQGRPFVIHLSSPDKFWRGLCDAIGRPELATDPRFVTKADRIENRDEIHDLLRRAFVQGDRASWLERLRRHDVPCSPINDLGEVARDPQVEHLDLIATVDHPIAGECTMVGSGVTLHGTPTRLAPAPMLGEHNDELLGGQVGVEDAKARPAETI